MDSIEPTRWLRRGGFLRIATGVAPSSWLWNPEPRHTLSVPHFHNSFSHCSHTFNVKVTGREGPERIPETKADWRRAGRAARAGVEQPPDKQPQHDLRHTFLSTHFTDMVQKTRLTPLLSVRALELTAVFIRSRYQTTPIGRGKKGSWEEGTNLAFIDSGAWAMLRPWIIFYHTSIPCLNYAANFSELSTLYYAVSVMLMVWY